MRLQSRFLTALLVLLGLLSCSPREQLMVIPRPASVQMLRGRCDLNNAPVYESKDASIPPEGYLLELGKNRIHISSSDDAGAFYARVTLYHICRQYGDESPAMRIVDSPRFSYRGAHIDVSRHFFDKDVICKQLRMFASLKLNRFHWHLTDGTGWRLQIDAYPELTAGIPHYTKDDVREVLALADSLHITIIPEIEMFGHSEEVLAVYPELRCGGNPEHPSEYCIGSEKTFEFLETVLGEVIDLFSSEYIHIGGDEANMAVWEACPRCQARMKAEGMAEVRQLQSYGIQRIEKFVNSRGRKIIGWDEILEGGLAENAVVMSWRGEEGGRKAAGMGHDVIMTPGSHCYIDAYQDAPYKEPTAFGGYVPLSKVYSYDPAPEDMPGREHVLGAQTNLWTEQVPVPEHLEYMLYPRVFAIAEVDWSPAEGKDYSEFRQRALFRLKQAHEDGYNSFDLENEVGERKEYLEPVQHVAVGCPVSYETTYADSYTGGGDSALTDGLFGSWTFQSRWQGFLNKDVIVTIDLGERKDIHEIKADFTQWRTAWICMPVEVSFEISDDGVNFRQLGTEVGGFDLEDLRPMYHFFSWNGDASGRYVKVLGRINERKWGWLFIDEIIVN